MTESTINLKDKRRLLLEKYQIRKSKKEKRAFADYVESNAKRLLWDYKEETSGTIIKSRNLVVGNLKTAKYIFTAHYDTCAICPVPNRLWIKNVPMGILFQLLITIILMMEIVGASIIISVPIDFFFKVKSFIPVMYAVLFALCWQLLFGYRNKHTANDNTSGVLTLLNLMENMPIDRLDDVAFVFFDNEEKGLIGSSLFKRMHKGELEGKQIINFDCVGEGNTVILACQKKTKEEVKEKMKASLPKDERFGYTIAKGDFLSFSSDQCLFPSAVGIAMANKSRLGGYTVGGFHTAKDTELQEKNIEYLTKWGINLCS